MSAISAKITFQSSAATKGVTAGYSGKTNTMFIKGVDEKVKSFIRICNLKGKTAFPFKIAQG